MGVERQHPDGSGRQRVAQVRVREEHRGTRVLEHEVQALTGVGRVQRDVGAPGLEHAEQADDEVERALQAQGHARVGADALGSQFMGELVGARVQLTVAQRQLAEAQGLGVRGSRGLGLERFMDAGGILEGCGGVVPLDQHLPLLGGAHQRQQGDALARFADGGFQDHAQVARHASGGGRIEQVGVVPERADETLGAGSQRQRQLELRDAARGVYSGERQAGEGERGLRQVLQDEQHLEERRAAHVSRGLEHLDQLLEGHVLVAVGAERRLSHLTEQRHEGVLLGDACAQGQGVDEEADESLGLRAVAACDGRADDEVVLAGVAVQQRVPGGQQHHEERGVVLAGERFEPLRQLGRELEGMGRAAEGLHGRTGLVGGQLQGLGRAAELLLPVAELGFERLIAQPVALPHRVVGVLHRQRRELGLHARGEGLIERRQLTDEHAQGPAVGDDVVHRHQQHVLLGCQSQERGTEEGTSLEVEGTSGLLRGQAKSLRLARGGGLPAQVHQGQREGGGGVDDLHGFAVVRGEGDAQGLMALDERTQGTFECDDL